MSCVISAAYQWDQLLVDAVFGAVVKMGAHPLDVELHVQVSAHRRCRPCRKETLRRLRLRRGPIRSAAMLVHISPPDGRRLDVVRAPPTGSAFDVAMMRVFPSWSATTRYNLLSDPRCRSVPFSTANECAFSRNTLRHSVTVNGCKHFKFTDRQHY